MSRIGKAPITVPDKVTVTVEDNLVSVKGPKGELSRQISKELTVALNDGVITVTRPSDDKVHRSLHGLSRTLINNMIIGVTEGYSKHLEIQGVGYRVAKKAFPSTARTPRKSSFPVSTRKKLVLLLLKSAACGLPNPTKAKGSAM